MVAAEKIRVSPEIFSYVNDAGDTLIVEVRLPDVAKENIHLRLRDDGMAVSASRVETEFASTLSFCCPVDAAQAHAGYENGLLRIEVPFRDPFADGRDIEFS
jgi:HSP20 family molecular chaperone IbpA